MRGEPRLDRELHAIAALDESETTVDLMIAASATDRRLAQSEIDEILGLTPRRMRKHKKETSTLGEKIRLSREQTHEASESERAT